MWIRRCTLTPIGVGLVPGKVTACLAESYAKVYGFTLPWKESALEHFEYATIFNFIIIRVAPDMIYFKSGPCPGRI